MKKFLRIFLVLSLALFPLIAGIDKAHAAEGLTAEVYNVRGQNNAPYIPQGLSPVLTRTVPNINFQWGSGSVLQGPSEDVIVRFTGSILSNTTQDISFYASADDGTKLYLDGVLITNDWFDKGGGGTTSAPIPFTAGVPKTIELMYYENGGGASVFLYWDQSGSMQIIPAEAFTSVAAPIVKTIGAPRNLTVTDGPTSTVLDWDAPNTGNTQPERYAISFTTQGQNGWGIATGNVGGPNSLNTTITIDHSLLESLMPSGTVWSFHIRSDNDTLALYSENSNVVTLKIGLTQAEKDAQAAAALAAQQELDRQSAANTAVTNYENQQIRTLSEVSIAEDLKILADTATATVLNQNVKATLQSRIDAKTSTVSTAKTLLIQARLEAEAAARLAAEQEAARIAAEQEAARQAAILAEAARVEAARQAAIAEAARVESERQAAIAEAARIEAARQAAIAESNRIAAEQEAARQAAIRAEQERLAEIARQAAIKAEQDRQAALEAARIQAEKDRVAAAEKAKAEEDARIAEEKRKKAEEDARIAEEQRKKAEEEARLAEEAKKKAEEEARIAEEKRIKAEAEAKAKAEEARLEAERIAVEKAAAEQKEKDRLAEEARLKAEAEAKAKAEEYARLEAIKKAQEEAKAKAEADRLAQIAKDKAAEDARILAEQKAKEAESARLRAEEERKIAEQKALNDGKITAEDTKKVLDNINSDGKVTQAEVKNIVEAIKQSGAPLTVEQKDLIATVVIAAAVSSGENVTAAQIQDAGIEYKDLPKETPVEVRTSESGEALVITAEVAANVELVTDAGALLEAAFTDPGAALAAIGSIGADMTKGEREEATNMVVATVVAAGAAMNAVGAAAGSTGGSSSGNSSGGGSGGGGASGNSKGVRRRP